MPGTHTDTLQVFGDPVTAVYTALAEGRSVLGTAREEAGKKYRFVKFNDGAGNVAAAANAVCYWLPTAADDYVVTSDESDSKSPMGVFVSAPADGGFCWVLTRGRVKALKTDGTDDIVLGDRLVAGESAVDGAVERAVIAGANPTAAETRVLQRTVGYALAADVDAENTVDAFVDLE